ncbi:uncharacterized protein PAC_03281 [Phialocephala subalpina]|uniref:Uncharacterized protein n=1 Tax=Phialocephala subalpina TaxID=576137 RepID=A0A1L7WKY9_9HELO|nr:uncharacterized protein PAC_03281 [Phialocephala subalpina]
MMDPIGTPASLITIWGTVQDMKKFHDKVKCAPKDSWLMPHPVNMQSVIASLPRRSNTAGQDDDPPREIVERCNAALEIIRKEAKDLLDNYEDVKMERSKQIWTRFRILWDRCKFVIDEDTIKALIQAVEYAKSTLYLALDAIILARTVSGHQGIQTCIQDLVKQMTAQAEVLDQIHRASQIIQKCDQLHVPAPEADSIAETETCSLSSTNRGKRIAQTFRKNVVERVKVAVTIPNRKRNGQHKTKSAKRKTVETTHVARLDILPNGPDLDSFSHLPEEDDELGDGTEWPPDDHEEGGFNIMFNGDQCELVIIDSESDAFEFNATTDRASTDQHQTAAELIANTKYVQPSVEDIEDEFNMNGNNAVVNADACWLVVNYVQPSVEENFEDELDINENYLPLDRDLPWVLEEHVESPSVGASSPPNVELEIPQADREQATSSRERDFGGPHDHRDQENADWRGLGNLKGRLRDLGTASGSFLREHGEDLGRNIESWAQNGCQYDPDSCGSSLQTWGGRFLEHVLPQWLPPVLPVPLQTEEDYQPCSRGFFFQPDLKAWVSVPP